MNNKVNIYIYIYFFNLTIQSAFPFNDLKMNEQA